MPSPARAVELCSCLVYPRARTGSQGRTDRVIRGEMGPSPPRAALCVFREFVAAPTAVPSLTKPFYLSINIYFIPGASCDPPRRAGARGNRLMSLSFSFPLRPPRLQTRGIKNPLSTRLHPQPHGDLLRLTGPAGRWEGARVSQPNHPCLYWGAPTQLRAVRAGGLRLLLPDMGGNFPLFSRGQWWEFLEGCCG